MFVGELVGVCVGVKVLVAVSIQGYEIHMGLSQGPALSRPLIVCSDDSPNKHEGAISADNHVIGTYWHGLFESAAACDALLSWAGLSAAQAIDYHALRDREIDRLANCIEQHVDLSLLETPFVAKDSAPTDQHPAPGLTSRIQLNNLLTAE